VIGQRSAPLRDDTPTVEHRMVAGETLDLLAKRHYGREDLWWRIADANPARFPLDYGPGDVVRIPLGPTVTTRPTGREGT
jgi:nucleoid-associated protein YgaU